MPDKELDITNIIIIVSFTIILLIAFIGVLLVLFYKRRIKSLAREKKIETEFKHALLESQLEIQEQTFKNISQEVHDNIGQVLSLAKLNVTTMDLNNEEAMVEKIGNSKQLLTKAIQDLRDLSKSLNTDYVREMGLQKSIEYEFELLRKSASVEASLAVEGKPFRLQPQEELIIFRIVQEIINNIIKHAEAKSISVMMQYDQLFFRLDIVDDGKGFDMTDSTVNSNDLNGIGIRNMYNRANMIGATFNLNTTLRKGTSVTLTLPIQVKT